MPGEPKLRGVILLDQVEYMKRTYGPALINDALSALTPADRETINDVLPISWVNVPAVTAFKSAIAAELGEDPNQFNRRLVRATIGETITSFWRLLLKQLWDSAVIKRTPIIYSKAFDRGNLALTLLVDGRAEFVLEGWPDMPEFDCAGLAAGIEALLEYAGRGRTTVRWKRRPALVVFEAKWTK